MARPIHNVLIRPLMTERSTLLRETANQYVFEVALDASKPEIKSLIEQQFKVKVRKVQTARVGGKWRRVGASMGQKGDWKKAVVTLAEGQKIDLIEEAN